MSIQTFEHKQIAKQKEGCYSAEIQDLLTAEASGSGNSAGLMALSFDLHTRVLPTVLPDENFQHHLSLRQSSGEYSLSFAY